MGGSQKLKKDGYVSLTPFHLGVLFYHPLVKTCHGQFVYQISPFPEGPKFKKRLLSWPHQK